MLRGRSTAVLGAIGLTAVVTTAVAVAAITPSKPYAVGIAEGYRTKVLLTVGDTVPETSDPSKQYQMVGIPDGLGAHRGKGQTTVLYMNHELVFNTPSRTTIGEPRDRGAVVSKYILDRNGTPISGERAYDEVYLENTFVGPAPTEANTTRSFSRFCSASLAGKAEGFDTEIYFANEESGGANTFDGLGGLAVAVIDNKAYGLPKLGHFAWENTLAQPNRGKKQVVLIGMEDGPAELDQRDRPGDRPAVCEQSALHVRRHQGAWQQKRAEPQRAGQRQALRARSGQRRLLERGDVHERLDRREVGASAQHEHDK